MSNLHRNILLILLAISVVLIVYSAYLIGENRKHDPYVQWPNAINTLEEEKKIDCPDGEIMWVMQSDAYGTDTSFPVCSDISDQD